MMKPTNCRQIELTIKDANRLMRQAPALLSENLTLQLFILDTGASCSDPSRCTAVRAAEVSPEWMPEHLNKSGAAES